FPYTTLFRSVNPLFLVQRIKKTRMTNRIIFFKVVALMIDKKVYVIHLNYQSNLHRLITFTQTLLQNHHSLLMLYSFSLLMTVSPLAVQTKAHRLYYFPTQSSYLSCVLKMPGQASIVSQRLR